MLHVLDTSVILSDPRALERLGDRDVVIPLVVLSELEDKRTHPELGFPARTALRYLEKLRLEHGTLTEEIPTKEGGTIRVEINNIKNSHLPPVFQEPANDNRILAVAFNLQQDGNTVTLMTKDLPLRLKASVVRLQAMDYSSEDSVDADWNGLVNLKIDGSVIDEIYEQGQIYLEETEIYPINTGILLQSPERQSALGRIDRSGSIRLIKTKTPAGLAPKNAEQTVALDLLCDPEIKIVSLGGMAGSGKTVMALAAGVEALKASGNSIHKIVVFRPVTAVGSQDLGFLPGSAEEKMAPWAAAIYDALESFMKSYEIRDLKLEVLPLTHIRGRTLQDSWVIIDEAQNLDIMVLVTALSRLGEGSKVILTHDVNQRDNLRVGKYDGIARVISTLSHSDLFAHISLNKSERSKIAELVASSFEL